VLAYRKTKNRITLAGVRLNPKIGVNPEERADPQECRADLTIWGDFEPAASSDSLDKTLDYCRVLATVQKTACGREYNLLEALAYAIVRDVLKDFPVSRANVKLRKRPSSLMSQLDFVEVEVENSR